MVPCTEHVASLRSAPGACRSGFGTRVACRDELLCHVAFLKREWRFEACVCASRRGASSSSAIVGVARPISDVWDRYDYHPIGEPRTPGTVGKLGHPVDALRSDSGLKPRVYRDLPDAPKMELEGSSKVASGAGPASTIASASFEDRPCPGSGEEA